jgi:TonB family protein
MKVAVKQHDSEALSSCVDFPVLRMNLKDQFNAMMLQRSGRDLKDNPFGALGMALASTVLDNVVNAFITPAGLANIMEGHRPQQPDSGNEGENGPQAGGGLSQQSEAGEGLRETNGPKRQPFKNYKYSYDGLSKFSAWVQNDEGQEIRFVFSRDGLSWKLTNILIPTIQERASTSSNTTGSNNSSSSAEPEVSRDSASQSAANQSAIDHKLYLASAIRGQGFRCEYVVEETPPIVTCHYDNRYIYYETSAGALGPVFVLSGSDKSAAVGRSAGIATSATPSTDAQNIPNSPQGQIGEKAFVQTAAQSSPSSDNTSISNLPSSEIVKPSPARDFPNALDYYPAESVRLREKGRPIVRVCVGPDGNANDEPTIITSSGSARLDKGALQLAKSGHYNPGTEDSKPVTACINMAVNFQLRN